MTDATTPTDRELLVLAAKAAGITIKPFFIKPVDPTKGDGFIGFITESGHSPRGWFNPLIDDGDALRLAVKLGLRICAVANGGTCSIAAHTADDVSCSVEENGNDQYAATRRAIVRAAAELGKAMP